MKKIFLSSAAVFAFLFVFLFAANTSAQTKTTTTTKTTQTKKKSKTVNVVGKAVATTRGANPKIKSKAPSVDKPVAKSRGNGPGSCTITFNNTTGLYVDVYVDLDSNDDLNYRGTLAPYESGIITVGDGYTGIYCESTGGTRDWVAAGDCSGDVTFNLQ